MHTHTYNTRIVLSRSSTSSLWVKTYNSGILTNILRRPTLMNLLNSGTRAAERPICFPPPFPHHPLSSLSAKSFFYGSLTSRSRYRKWKRRLRRVIVIMVILHICRSLILSFTVRPPFFPSLFLVSQLALSLSSFLSLSLFSVPRSRCGASLETRATSKPARVSSFLSRASPFQSARSRRNGHRDEEEGKDAGREDRVSFVTR